MRTRYCACYLVGTALALGSAFALPPASDLAARSNQSAPPRAQAVPTPTQVSNSTAQNAPSLTVVIDPGHGGFDRGGIPGQRVPEKVMNLDVALRLRSVLQASGYRVVMTRDTDVFIPLGTRVAIANSYRNAIFVCIHFNSASRSGANGIETYFYTSQSLSLASAIHYRVAGGAPSANRGVRRRGYFVLRRTVIPAVLVECGFLTNPTEAEYAQSASYQQKLAEEIAAGIGSRNSVSSRFTSAETVPLQPFIDQTHVRDPDLTRSKHSKKSSHSKSSSSKKKKKSSDTDQSDTKAKRSPAKDSEG